MKNPDSVGWLLENGGPIIRYLTKREILSLSTSTEKRLEDQLMQTNAVRYWMGCLNGRIGFNDIHGSRDTCFENAAGKLTVFGVRPGIVDFNQRCQPYLRVLERRQDRLNVIEVLRRTIIASLLAMAGYLVNAAVREWIAERLDTIFAFARHGHYSVYIDKDKFKGIPRAYNDYPFINPDLYIDGRFALPWIYDVFAFSALLNFAQDRSVTDKVGKVISYILDSRYQRLHDGYGIVLTANSRYNVMGWNVWLPGYNGLHANDFKMGCLVQRLELMSRFPVAVSSHWFESNLDRLQQYATDNDTYIFPLQYIKEQKNSYFVTGAHMGLGENRRRQPAYEIESTYWMMKMMNKMKMVEDSA